MAQGQARFTKGQREAPGAVASEAEQTIFRAGTCYVAQDMRGEVISYRVMSRNNVCLFESMSAAKAVEYAEWHAARRAA